MDPPHLSGSRSRSARSGRWEYQICICRSHSTVAIGIDLQQSSLNRLGFSRGFHYQAEQTEVAQCRVAQPGLSASGTQKCKRDVEVDFHFRNPNSSRSSDHPLTVFPVCLLGTFTRPYPHGRILCAILRIQFAIRIGSVQFLNLRLISSFSTVSIR